MCVKVAHSSSPVFKKITPFTTPQALSIAAIIIGLILRFYLFASGRMLWQDEAMLAINLATRSGSELLEPFTFTQLAPIGWIIVTDWLHQISGDFEIAARLPGFIASCLSLIIFPKLTKQLFSGYTASILVALFAISGVLIDYTAQLKPYAMDVLLCVSMLTLCFTILNEKKPTQKTIILLGTTTLFGAFFTFTAPFVLGGIGGTLIVKTLLERQWSNALLLVLTCGIAGLIYVALGFGLYQPQANNAGFHSGYAEHYFQNLYAPFPPKGLGDLTWYYWWGIGVFEFFAGFQSAYLWIFSGLAGAYLIWRRSSWQFSMVMMPFVLSILLSMPQIYPLLPRVNLYYLPLFMILVGETINFILRTIDKKDLPIIASVLFLALATGSIWNLGYFSFANLSAAKSDLSEELLLLKKNYKEGETILVARDQAAQFIVYRKEYGLEQAKWGITELQEDCQRSFMTNLSHGDRFWLLRSLHNDRPDFDSRFNLVQTSEGLMQRSARTVLPILDEIEIKHPTPLTQIPKFCDMPYRLSDEEMLGGASPIWPNEAMWKRSSSPLN